MSKQQEQFEAALSKALLAANIISKAELNEALEQQVLTGGHLATNLWELGLCDIATLTRLSAEILKLKPVPPQVVEQVPAKILRLMSRSFVEKHRLLPLRIKGRELGIATAEPWNIAALDEAARHSRLRVKPFFLAEVPLTQLMDKLYKIPAGARFKIKPQVRYKPSQQQSKKEEELTQDLISDEEFAAIYGAGDGAKKPASPPPVAAAATSVSQSNLAQPLSVAAKSTAAKSPLPAPPTPPTPPPTPAAPPPLTSSTAPLPPLATVITSDDTFMTEAMTAEDEAVLEEVYELADVVETSETPEPSPSAQPITTSKEAYALLDKAQDRDELGEILVRFALSRGKRAVLFTRQGDLWIGWTGAGEGVTPTAVRSLMLPSEKGTLFGLVGSTGAHFLGPIQKHTVHDRFLELLGGAKPNSAGLFPVRFRGRLVFGIYMDGGNAGFVNPDIADILILAQRVPLAVERLLRQKEQQAG